MTRPIFEPSTGRKLATEHWNTDQLYRRPIPPTPQTIHFCYTRHPTQTISSSTTVFDQVEISQLYSSDVDYFIPGDPTTYPDTILCRKKGLYHLEIHVSESFNLVHENRGYPHDVAPYYPGNSPVIVAPQAEVDPNVAGSGWLNESAAGSFEAYQAGVNSVTDPPKDRETPARREYVCVWRQWFTMNADDPTDMAVGAMYRQVTGFDQTITSNTRIAIFHFPSDADDLEFSELTHFTY